jgi:hypothetical protein
MFPTFLLTGDKTKGVIYTLYAGNWATGSVILAPGLNVRLIARFQMYFEFLKVLLSPMLVANRKICGAIPIKELFIS